MRIFLILIFPYSNYSKNSDAILDYPVNVFHQRTPFCPKFLVMRRSRGEYLSFIDPERGGFGVIFPEVMIFSEENIITEGNIAESPSGGSINDILYRKLKNSLSSE